MLPDDRNLEIDRLIRVVLLVDQHPSSKLNYDTKDINTENDEFILAIVELLA